MATTAGAVKTLPFRGTGRGGRVVLLLDVVIGASGAVGSYSRQDDPNLTAVENGTGIYDLTFPKCVKARIKGAVYSPLLSVVDVVCTALDAGAGTATVKVLHDDATATEPASGDILWLEFMLDTQNV